MVVEVTVSIKGEDSTFKQKFLEYGDFMMKYDDETIQRLIKETQDQCKIIPEDIKVRCMMQIE